MAVLLRRRMEWILLGLLLLAFTAGGWGFWLLARPPASFVMVTVYSSGLQKGRFTLEAGNSGVLLRIDRITYQPAYEAVPLPGSPERVIRTERGYETVYIDGTLRNDNQFPVSVIPFAYDNPATGDFGNLARIGRAGAPTMRVPVEVFPLVRLTDPPGTGIADCPLRPEPGLVQLVLAAGSEAMFTVPVSTALVTSRRDRTAIATVFEEVGDGILPTFSFARIVSNGSCGQLSGERIFLTTGVAELGEPEYQDFYPFGWPSCEGGEISPDRRPYWIPWRFVDPKDRRQFHCP